MHLVHVRSTEADALPLILTHVMLYWLTGTAGASAREYYEDARTGASYRDLRNTVPTGVAVFRIYERPLIHSGL